VLDMVDTMRAPAPVQRQRCPSMCPSSAFGPFASACLRDQLISNAKSAWELRRNVTETRHSSATRRQSTAPSWYKISSLAYHGTQRVTHVDLSCAGRNVFRQKQ
jgi:hypothetical protein